MSSFEVLFKRERFTVSLRKQKRSHILAVRRSKPIESTTQDVQETLDLFEKLTKTNSICRLYQAMNLLVSQL
jgi:hypothetical protein